MLLLLFSCNSESKHKASDFEKAYEKMLLGFESEYAIVYPKIKAKIEGSSHFVKEGNFYKATKKVVLFGAKVTYLGIDPDQSPGPNAVVIGSPEAIAKNIELRYNITLDKNGSDFGVELSEYITLIIGPHPSNENQSILIAYYLGS